jgi:hypothetical protein
MLASKSIQCKKILKGKDYIEKIKMRSIKWLKEVCGPKKDEVIQQVCIQHNMQLRASFRSHSITKIVKARRL